MFSRFSSSTESISSTSSAFLNQLTSSVFGNASDEPGTPLHTLIDKETERLE